MPQRSQQMWWRTNGQTNSQFDSCENLAKLQTTDLSSLMFVWICRHVFQQHGGPADSIQMQHNGLVASLVRPDGDHKILSWQDQPTNTICTNTHKSKTVTSHKSSKSLDLRRDGQTNGDRRESQVALDVRTLDRKVQVRMPQNNKCSNDQLKRN